jgi:hypothetical protein
MGLIQFVNFPLHLSLIFINDRKDSVLLKELRGAKEVLRTQRGNFSRNF